MSLEIKNLVINVHVSDSSEHKKQENDESFRSEILNECRELVRESVEKMRER
jgi:hypothetical protein